MYKLQENAFEAENIEVIKDEVVSIEGAMKANKLVLKEHQIEADGIFILRDSVSPKQLVPGLELDGNHVKVNRSMETNINGLFACCIVAVFGFGSAVPIIVFPTVLLAQNKILTAILVYIFVITYPLRSGDIIAAVVAIKNLISVRIVFIFLLGFWCPLCTIAGIIDG